MAGRQPVSWLGANFWSRTGGPLMWRSYDPAVDPRGTAAYSRAHGLTMTRSFFYWPDFMPGRTRSTRTMTARFADFLDRHAEQGLTHDPDLHRRPHVRARTGIPPGGAAATCTPTSGWSAGRPGSPARWSAASARTPRSRAGWSPTRCRSTAATRHRPRDRRHLGADHQGRGARGRRPPAVLARRRRLGHRGHRQRQRLPARRRAAAHRDFLGPHVYPVGDDPIRQHYAAARRLRAGRHVRQAGDHGGVRRQLRLRLRRQRGPLLPARPAQHAAGRARPAGSRGTTPTSTCPARTRTGTTPSSSTSASPTRHGTPKATLHEMRAFARDAGRHRADASCERDRHRHRPDRLRLPGHQYPFTSRPTALASRRTLHQAYVSRPARRPAAGADQGNRRHRARTRGCTSPRRSSSCSRPPPPRWSGSRQAAPASTCPTRRATPPGTAGRRTGG